MKIKRETSSPVDQIAGIASYSLPFQVSAGAGGSYISGSIGLAVRERWEELWNALRVEREANGGVGETWRCGGKVGRRMVSHPASARLRCTRC
jgi:hypothetical protein